MSNALERVTNGRAAAPPCWICSIGVSTSRKPCSSNVRRSEAFAFARAMTLSRAWSRTIRSRKRERTRPSSESSVCRFGSGRSAFEAIAQSDTMIDSSPRRLEIT